MNLHGLAGDAAHDLWADLLEWQYFFGKAGAGYESRHSPNYAGGLVLSLRHARGSIVSVLRNSGDVMRDLARPR